MTTFDGPARLRRSLADASNPESLAAKCRTRRHAELLHRFPNLREMRVLDLGGLPNFWVGPLRPAAVTTVNLVDAPTPEPWMTHIVSDACFPASALNGENFDLVFSNSLLEHVGGFIMRRRLADVIHARSAAHWVQTPYRYFPLEPHWLAPGWQYLPVAARAAVLRIWPLAYAHFRSRGDAFEEVLSIELLCRSEMSFLFPYSEIWRERISGLTKSLVAVRT